MARCRIDSVAGAQLSAIAISVSFFALHLYATPYLQDVLGLSAIDAGLAYVPGTATMFFVSGASAQLGERVAPKAMISGCLALVGVGLALIRPGADDDRRSALELARDPAGMMLAAIGSGLFNPALSSVALSSAPPAMSGLAAGVNDTARQAGIAVGIAGLGALIPAHAVYLHSGGYVHGVREALLVAPAWPWPGRSPRGG